MGKVVGDKIHPALIVKKKRATPRAKVVKKFSLKKQTSIMMKTPTAREHGRPLDLKRSQANNGERLASSFNFDAAMLGKFHGLPFAWNKEFKFFGDIVDVYYPGDIPVDEDDCISIAQFVEQQKRADESVRIQWRKAEEKCQVVGDTIHPALIVKKKRATPRTKVVKKFSLKKQTSI